LQELKPLRLGMPDSETQKYIADQLFGLEKTITDLENQLTVARNFRIKLSNEKIGVANV